ncbi:MAG: type II toxin-antitoxin system VapC family toxin [Gammaproteobacteria bacterium]
MATRGTVIYWDASAVLSVLFRDAHSDAAMDFARRKGRHLVSSLAWAEVHAVIARMEREKILADVQASAAREALTLGPWRFLHVQPSSEFIAELAMRWPLRGADLWHLALAKTLQAELPELCLLSFDKRLNTAAEGEQLVLNPG